MAYVDNDIDDGVKQYFNCLKDCKPLTKDKEQELMIRYKVLGDLNARDELIRANLRYACKIASSYRGRGIPYSDLIAEANDGLIDAIEHFDISRNVKLFSYAKWRIMQHLGKAIELKNRIPETELPTDHESKSVTDDEGMASPLYEGEEFNFVDDDVREADEVPIDAYIEKVLSTLTPRELDMVNMYYGREQEGKKEYNLEEIGNKYGLTKERVRQIIEKAFLKIRSEAILVDSSYFTR